MLIKYLFQVSKNFKNNLFLITGTVSGIQSYQRTYHAVVFSHIRAHTMYTCAEEHNFPLICTLATEDIDHFAIVTKIVCQYLV
jgi:hypothetical protein